MSLATNSFVCTRILEPDVGPRYKKKRKKKGIEWEGEGKRKGNKKAAEGTAAQEYEVEILHTQKQKEKQPRGWCAGGSKRAQITNLFVVQIHHFIKQKCHQFLR